MLVDTPEAKTTKAVPRIRWVFFSEKTPLEKMGCGLFRIGQFFAQPDWLDATKRTKK